MTGLAEIAKAMQFEASLPADVRSIIGGTLFAGSHPHVTGDKFRVSEPAKPQRKGLLAWLGGIFKKAA